MRAPSFRKTTTSTGPVYYLEDEEIDFDEILASGPILALGKGVGWGSHWLAIEGVQPAVPQNPSPAELGLVSPTATAATTSVNGTSGAGEAEEPQAQAQASNGVGVVPATLSGTAQGRKDQVVVRPLVKHVLSRELQLYFERLTSAISDPSTSADTASPRNAFTGTPTGAQPHPHQPADVLEDAMHDLPPASDSRLGSLVTIAQQSSGNSVRDAALASLRGDPGLHQLVPYLVQWVGERIGLMEPMEAEGLNHMLLVVHALLVNPHIFIEPYLHQLMPSILSVLLTASSLESNSKGPTRQVGTGYTVRAHAALLLCHIATHYGKTYPSLRPRIVATLLKALLAGTNPCPNATERTGAEALAASQASHTAPTASVATKLGALLGLRCLGSAVVETFLLGPSGVIVEQPQQQSEPHQPRHRNNNVLSRLGAWVERLSETDVQATAWLSREVRLALQDVARTTSGGNVPTEDQAQEVLVNHYGSFWTAQFVSDPLARHALFHAVVAPTGLERQAEQQQQQQQGDQEDQQQAEKSSEQPDGQPHAPSSAAPQDTIMAEADAPAAPSPSEQPGQPAEQPIEAQPTGPTPAAAPGAEDAQPPTEPTEPTESTESAVPRTTHQSPTTTPSAAPSADPTSAATSSNPTA